jgi:hypothetical protein
MGPTTADAHLGPAWWEMSNNAPLGFYTVARNRRLIMAKEELTMTDLQSSKEADWFEKVTNRRMAIVEVIQGETDKEAWQRHLAAHPDDRHAPVWVFNRPWVP